MTEYNPDEYYIHSRDTKGHGAHIRTQVPTNVARQIAVLIADPRLPYKTPADFVRDAIVHRIAKVEADLPDLEPTVDTFVRQANLALRIERRLTCEKLVHGYWDEMTKASPAEQEEIREEIVAALEDESLTDAAHNSLEVLLDRFAKWDGGPYSVPPSDI